MHLDNVAAPTVIQTSRTTFIAFVILVVIIGGTGLFAYTSNQRRVSLPVAETPQLSEVPSLEANFPPGQVAGASNSSTNTSGFAEIDAVNLNVPTLGTVNSCKPGTVFMIGEQERNPHDNPADEFNWVDALDVVADYKNPFIVGVSSNRQFPWRTDAADPDTLHTKIVFNYAGEVAEAALTLGWSPGNQGERQKEILLDNTVVGKTQFHYGSFAPNNWQYMPLVQDTIPFKLTPGIHTVTVNTFSKGDGEAVWDFVKLDVISCE